MSDNQYTTGEGYAGYQKQIQDDLPGVAGLQQANNIIVNGTPTGFSKAGNDYAARLRFQAQAQVVAAVPETPSSGVSVPSMGTGVIPNNSTDPQHGGTTFTHPEGNAANVTPAIYNWTPERYMA